MKNPLFDSVEDLVLHRPPLLLLQSVSHWDVGHVEAIADPVDSYLFADGEGNVPAWVGLEYMAQAISAYAGIIDRKSTRLNSSHVKISYAVFCLKKKR